MRNTQGDVNAENIGGTYDQEHELNKKIGRHKVVSKEDRIKEEHITQEKIVKDRNDKVSGVHAENVAGSSKEKNKGI